MAPFDNKKRFKQNIGVFFFLILFWYSQLDDYPCYIVLCCFQSVDWSLCREDLASL